MFDLERMKKAVEGENFRVPSGLNLEQMKFLLMLPEDTRSDLQFLTDENMKIYIRELMLEKKVWDSEVLETGGVSYYKLDNHEKRVTSDGTPFKSKYRVALTLNSTSAFRRKAILEGKEDMSLLKPLKFKIKDASGNIFSVASKTCGEAQAIVDSLYGKGHYRVSQMIV